MAPVTASSFFDALRVLSPLRIISINGPSVFEAIASVGPFGIANGYLNIMQDAYHWHLDVARFRHLRSQDSTHGRSGRRVLFFELREQADAEPFLRIYLHRGKGEEFEPAREEAFQALHAVAADSVELEVPA